MGTKEKMHLKLNKVYLGDSLINTYCFMEDYYFVAGDNLPVSVDSRYWGVLPRSFIVGKVAFVWLSVLSHLLIYNGISEAII